MGVAIGIDLGTTNTAVAAVVDGVAVTLEDERGRRLLPSVVSFHPSGSVLVGEPAKERQAIDPENTVYSVKPLIGRTFDSEEVTQARTRFPFELVEGAKKSTMVHARGVEYALPEISAFVLRRAKAIAEAALKTSVDRAVITVPANFNDLQRASTKIAGKLAGLEVMRILNEPTAAALAYGQSIAKAEKIAVYDLGGGTFDVTLLDLTGNVFEVLATAGDTALGGDDVDRVFAERIALEVTKRFNVDVRSNPVAFSKLKHIAESLKKELSTKDRAEREITDIGWAEGGRPIAMPFSFTRAELERLALPLVERTIAVARHSIEAVGLTARSFDRVILVGGSTRMPLVGKMVQELFGQAPNVRVNPDEVVALGAAIQAHALSRTKVRVVRAEPSVAKAVRPEPSVAKPPPPVPGKAPPPVPGRPPPVPAQKAAPAPPASAPKVDAFQLSKPNAIITFSPPPPPVGGDDDFVSSATELSFGIPTPRVFQPEPPPTARGLPASDDLLFELELDAISAQAAAQPAVAPRAAEPTAAFEDLVATGGLFGNSGGGVPADARAAQPIGAEAFARGSAIATSLDAPLLIDVTPLSLRVETVAGYSDVLIDANSPVPCEKTRSFRTASDNQSHVVIRVSQGENTKFAENTFLGELELSGLRAARRGELTIVVTFELDSDGILGVRALDKETGRETAAKMKILGTTSDDADMAAMAARQARHQVS